MPKAAAYFVTVERRGVAPLETRLLVRAPSRRAAGELASWLAERERGGMFEATMVRRARGRHTAYDDAEAARQLSSADAANATTA